jgi:hypothetical protein
MPIVKFNQLKAPDHLRIVWGVAIEDLSRIDTTPDLSAFYSEMKIPKRGKAGRNGFRTVYKVEWGVLNQLQKNISRDIDDTVTFPETVQGFIRQRSTVKNAKIHVGQRVIVHADIADFFDSIDFAQVKSAFIGLGCNDAIANLLAKVCTLNGRLPQGASTSPILSNLVCSSLDLDLSSFAARQSVRYSRYADDLTFSGDAPVDIEAIRRIVVKQGFKLRDRKIRTQWRGKSQFVTGLSVADPAGPRAPSVVKRRLRLELHYAKKYGVSGHLERIQSDWSPFRMLACWRGWIDYLNSIPAEQELAARLLKELAALPP